MAHRTLVTSIGEITVDRRYYHCPQCGGATPWDQWAGLEGRMLTPAARRMVVLVIRQGPEASVGVVSVAFERRYH
jgi:hypothetical protein